MIATLKFLLLFASVATAAGGLSVSASSRRENRFVLGNFEIVQHGLMIQVFNADKIVWQTLPNLPFVKIGNASLPRPPILDGNFQMEENILYETITQTIDSIDSSSDTSKIMFMGSVSDIELSVVVEYTFTLSVSFFSMSQLQFDLQISPHCPPEMNRLFLSYWAEENETFHGFGESFTDFKMNGRRIPILVSEQGVGRGTEPITTYLNSGTEGVGGHWYTTYCPKPLYLTSSNRSVIFENSEVIIYL
jgi:hypothetical protein